MKEKTAPQLLSSFIDGLTKASGAAHQMVHQHQDPRFLPIRDRLEMIKSRCIKIAIKGTPEALYVKH